MSTVVNDLNERAFRMYRSQNTTPNCIAFQAYRGVLSHKVPGAAVYTVTHHASVGAPKTMVL
jgi:hypothetical protein